MEAIVKFFVNLTEITLALTGSASEILFDLFYWILYGKHKPCPPITDKLLLMSATGLAKKIRRREVSAEEVMRAYIGRIEAVQPVVNAVVDSRFEEALADARAVDRLLESRDKSEADLASEKPLLGVPFSCKEIIGVKDLAQTNCMKSLKDRKASDDSEAAALYRKAGAIPVVVTNIPTMTLWYDSYNPVFGATKNPYNTNRSAGGSSGGEAALIASAGSVIGIGNDLGGSIRLPSAFCGIYGHKSSSDIISNKSTSPVQLPQIDPFFSTGPMCRYVEDLNLLVSILTEKNGDKLRLDEKVNFKNVKVYYMEEFPGCLLSATSDMKAAVRKAANYFREEYDVSPTPVKMEELKHAIHIWLCKVFEAAGSFIRPGMEGGSGQLNLCKAYLMSILGYSDFDFRNLYFYCIELQKEDKHYKKGLEMFNSLEKKFQEILDGDAIMILPSHPQHAMHPAVTIPKFRRIGYTAIFNVLGLPGTAIPAGFSKGLPIGLQVIAAKNNDYLTLAAAVELNKLFGGWKSPCPVLV